MSADAGGRMPSGPAPPSTWRRAARAMARAVGRHPGLLGAGVVQVLRLARPRWWRRWPPVPVPTSELWRFRMETAYGGSGDAVPEEEDVVSFLRWAREMRHWRRR